jgi:hypothetical protein
MSRDSYTDPCDARFPEGPRFLVLSVTAFHDGHSFTHDDLTVPDSWRNAFFQIERAWLDAFEYIEHRDECLSIVLVWEREGQRFVFHCACGRQVWEALCEDGPAFRQYVLATSIPMD